MRCHLSVVIPQSGLMKVAQSPVATLAHARVPRSTRTCFWQHSICEQVHEELEPDQQLDFVVETELTIPQEHLSTNSTLSLSLE